MCLIIMKPRHHPLPSAKIIKQSFQNNKDGFGLAYTHRGDDAVHIRKGAMTLADANAMLNAVPNPFEADILMHFRFATEGRVWEGNCHPFPITKRIRDLVALDLSCRLAIAHNGIIFDLAGKLHIETQPLNPYHSSLQAEFSDTQLFIQNYLALIGEGILNKGVGRLIQDYTESKFAILAPQRIVLIGDFIEDDGIYYSNTGYKYSIIYTDYYGDDEDWWRTHPGEPSCICEICGEVVFYTYLVEGVMMCTGCHQYFKPYPKSISGCYDGFP